MSDSLILPTILAAVVGGMYVETNFSPPNSDGPLGLPTSFGFTPAILVVVFFWTFFFGLSQVNAARKKYSELAKEDGEKDVDERYGLPNLYAQGTSKHVRAFNCVQRGHQQIFEHLTQTCVTTLVSAMHYPILAAITTFTYAVGRREISNGYAASEGDAKKRYQSKLAPFMWYAYIGSLILCMFTSIDIVRGKKLFE